MLKSTYESQANRGFTTEEKQRIAKELVSQLDRSIQRILLIPPDYTRKHSGAGEIASFLYESLRQAGIESDVLPALGTHKPMTEDELQDMFPGIPMDRFIVHSWRNDTVQIGEIPSDFVSEVSEGIVDFPIDIFVNKHLVSGDYDLLISIGQVIPHEVVGMANYSKNIFVGCGGEDIINKSHFVGAAYGMERLLGKDHSPVRELYDYAQTRFFNTYPMLYVLSANTMSINPKTGLTDILSLHIGAERDTFEAAVAASQQNNITVLDKAPRKVVVYLDETEFKSTWLGCKAIYRTRMAIADGGELIIVAPGLQEFGEDEQISQLIRKYGYVGRDRIVQLVDENPDLQANLSAAAHLIHGSSDDRFHVTFVCDKLSKSDIEGVNFSHLSGKEFASRYTLADLSEGYNTLASGEELYYISNPATGLWVAKENW